MRESQSRIVEWTVTGMDCGSCAGKVRTAVERLPGVSEAEVALMTERLRLRLANDGADPDDIAKVLNKIGFGAELHEDSLTTEHSHDNRGRHQAPSGTDHAPVRTAWHQTHKGRYLIGTGLLLALAWLAKLLPLGEAGHLPFVAACLIGVWPVARRALALLQAGVPFSIEGLMTVAAIGALLIDAAEEAAVVVFLFAVGEMLEAVAAERARRGIRALSALLPETALLVHGDQIDKVPTSSLTPGQIIRLRAGDRLPADGVIVAGAGGFDESALTGESMPVLRAEGDQVMAGAIATDATLDVQVTAASGENTIARIARLVEEAESARAPTERFIEAFARVYMPIIVGLSLLVAIMPPLFFGGAWSDWTYRALTLLLVGCPCALVISVPAAVASALAAGTRAGLLFKGGAALEAAARLRHVAFDKTGTLTEGQFSVTALHPSSDLSEADLLLRAASVETGSNHPLAQAILAATRDRGLPLLSVKHARSLPGIGAEADIDGVRHRAVSLRHARETGLPDQLLSRAEAAEANGSTLVLLLAEDRALGLIALADRPRPEAADALADLRAQGLHLSMLTGDNAGAAAAVAKELDLPLKADLLPQDKMSALSRLANDGGVMMVGDGINDAPALKLATLGVAMGRGTDVAMEAAGAAILRNDLRAIPAMVDLARRTRANILQNVVLALGLKAVFMVLSVTGDATLWMAVLADTGATVAVTLNALRLQRKIRVD